MLYKQDPSNAVIVYTPADNPVNVYWLAAVIPEVEVYAGVEDVFCTAKLLNPGGAAAAGIKLIVPVPLLNPGHTDVERADITPGADEANVKLTVD